MTSRFVFGGHHSLDGLPVVKNGIHARCPKGVNFSSYFLLQGTFLDRLQVTLELSNRRCTEDYTIAQRTVESGVVNHPTISRICL